MQHFLQMGWSAVHSGWFNLEPEVGETVQPDMFRLTPYRSGYLKVSSTNFLNCLGIIYVFCRRDDLLSIEFGCVS